MFPGSSPITVPHSLQKHTRSQGPFLRRRYPASTVPMTLSDSRLDRHPSATLRRDPPPDGPPPITRITFPTCRAHYPGGPEQVLCWFLPRPRGLPRYLRRVGIHDFTFEACSSFTRVTACRLLNRPTRPLSRGFNPAGYPAERSPATRSNRQLSGWILPPLVIRAFGAH